MQTFKRVGLSILLLTVAILFSSCSEQSPEQSKKTEKPNNSQIVVIENFSFSPIELTIEKGDTVTWANEDNAPHTILIEGSYDSPKINRGDSFSYTFNELGKFNYHCSIHPSMKGTIIVK